MQKGIVRIIGGKWRGRRLKVPDVKGLRPTPDRVRETLFNWLGSHLLGARCLDLFAGSGALGFEALSRGAAYVELVDQSKEVISLLKEEFNRLNEDKAGEALIYQAKIPGQLRKADFPFNILFLDPPYQDNLLFLTCEYLEKEGYLAKNALIYLEAPTVIKDNELPSTWRLQKVKQAGQVMYHLASRDEE